MKSILAAAILTSVAVMTATAGITINSEFGQLRDADGVVISNSSTLYVLIYDADGNGTLPGGIESNSSLGESNASLVYEAFSGISFTPGLQIGGDRVFKVGYFNDEEGYSNPVLNQPDFDDSGITLSVGRTYAFYWFPGLTTNTVPSGSFQVGGINELVSYVGTGSNFIGMQIPADGSAVTTSILDDDLGGTLLGTRFTAIEAVPEPSVFSLVVMAGFGWAMRRSRR